jgi:penicillin-binding protein 1A
VYLAALRAGLDVDATINAGPITVGDYTPENFGGRTARAVPVQQAFASSINTAAVRLSEALGRDSVIAAARDLGIRSPLQSTASVALGAYEVNLLELTAAYCAVAAGAYPVKPWAITGFGEEPDLEGPPDGAGKWALEAKADLRSLLQSVVRLGSGRRASLPIPAYGKTGTSQKHRDAWFIGFAGNLVAGVWVGNDDSSPMSGVTGGQLPAQIWHDFMAGALERGKIPEQELPQIAAFPAEERHLDGTTQLAADALAAKPQRSSRAAEFTYEPKPTGRKRVRDRWAGPSDPPQNRVLPNARGFLRHLFN